MEEVDSLHATDAASAEIEREAALQFPRNAPPWLHGPNARATRRNANIREEVASSKEACNNSSEMWDLGHVTTRDGEKTVNSVVKGVSCDSIGYSNRTKDIMSSAGALMDVSEKHTTDHGGNQCSEGHGRIVRTRSFGVCMVGTCEETRGLISDILNPDENGRKTSDTRVPPTQRKIMIRPVMRNIHSLPDHHRKSSATEIVDRVECTVNTVRKKGESLQLDSDDIMKEKVDSVLLPWQKPAAYPAKHEGRLRRSNTELAERSIPEPELHKLRAAALRMKERMKVGAAGVTQAVVESIHEKWNTEEVVKMRFEGPPSLDMRRIHETLESKTGGIIIWRSGRSLVLYRGMTYNISCAQVYTKLADSEPSNCEKNGMGLFTSVGTPHGMTTETSEIENLLDQLGPRFSDWSGRGPTPVDADLLPAVVPGYETPFRLLPYKTRPALSNKEMTNLRRHARQISPHFALGRNRQLQGLASAIVKLWEKSAIAKIAIKRGIPNTCNDQMAEGIRKLTGGVLLSRDKEYIVLYRGNDYVTPLVRKVLLEKEKLAAVVQDTEEDARLRESALLTSSSKTSKCPSVAGTLAETLEAISRWNNALSTEERTMVRKDMTLNKHASVLRFLERKLYHARVKVEKAEKALAKVQEHLVPAELPTDLETVTDEERSLFRSIGLKMKTFLLVGRRDVFDGTVQNMHLHWKHRELVKIIVRGKSFGQAKQIAIALEAESGGVLISLDKTTKGYAIVVYRGKNYQRPQVLRPKNLLTKRKALERSIELQRREALNRYITTLQDQIQTLRTQLDKMKDGKFTKDPSLSMQVKNALLSDVYNSEDFKDEGEEAYLETYISGDESDNH